MRIIPFLVIVVLAAGNIMSQLQLADEHDRVRRLSSELERSTKLLNDDNIALDKCSESLKTADEAMVAANQEMERGSKSLTWCAETLKKYALNR